MQITRENYRAYDAVNYSKLSSLDKHPKKVNEERDFSDGLRNGNILDILAFDGQEAFDEKYFVSTVKKLPSDAVKAIIEACVDYPDEDGILFSDEILLEKARLFNYGSNWKDNTVVRKIREDGDEYIHQLELSKGKTVIDYELYVSLIDAANLLKESPKTKMFFIDSDFQKPFTEVINDVRYKCLLDIYTETKEYSIVADLKYTSSSLKWFESDFLKWRYDLQSSLYSDITTAHTKKPTKYYMIVYSSVDRAVMKFRVDPFTIQCGRKGGYDYKGKWRKGYEELTKELLWHQEHNLWDHSYEYYHNSELIINPYRKLGDNGSLIIRR